MVTWLDEVVAAFEEIGGPAKLDDLYTVVKRRRSSLPTNYKSIIRKEIEHNSSDSKAWQGKRDLFGAPDGKGAGVWQLRGKADRDEVSIPQKFISDLTSPSAVRKAIKEYDALGEEVFLSTYGFAKSREYPLSFGDKLYASKAIAAVAFGYQFPEFGPFQTGFSGGIAPGAAANVLSRIGFKIENMPGTLNGWSLEECEVTADVYFDCLRKKLERTRYVRQQAIRDVAQKTGRSEGAVDRKFQNIDAVLFEAGLPRLNDALAANIQNLLRYVVLDPLAERFKELGKVKPTVEPVRSLSNVFVDTPKGRPSRNVEPENVKPAKLNFAKIEERNRDVGRAGEKFVIEVERLRLTAQGRPDLAGGVEHVSQDEGDGHGYDIRSFDPDGTTIFIEVKTTNQDERSPFFISANELRAAARLGDRYQLYRVFNFSTKPQIYVLRGPLEGILSLSARTYLASPNQLRPE